VPCAFLAASIFAVSASIMEILPSMRPSRTTVPPAIFSKRERTEGSLCTNMASSVRFFVRALSKPGNGLFALGASDSCGFSKYVVFRKDSRSVFALAGFGFQANGGMFARPSATATPNLFASSAAAP
jgi:hypothetical protein